MAYEYNPLIPLNLQKKQDAATPGDIDRLQGEIDTLTADMRNKVPKFFTSIEELEIGEIGEYQGETNDEFTHGYFYERIEATPSQYEDITIPSGAKKIVYTNKFDSSQRVVYEVEIVTLDHAVTTQFQQSGYVSVIDAAFKSRLYGGQMYENIFQNYSIIPNTYGLFYSLQKSLRDLSNELGEDVVATLQQLYEILQDVEIIEGFRASTANPGVYGRVVDVYAQVLLPICVYNQSGVKTQTATQSIYVLASELAAVNWDISQIAPLYNFPNDQQPNRWVVDTDRLDTYYIEYWGDIIQDEAGNLYAMSENGSTGQGAGSMYRTISADGKQNRYIDINHLSCVFNGQPISTSDYWAQNIDLRLYFDYNVSWETTTEAITIHRKIQQYDEYGFPIADVATAIRRDTQPSINPSDFATAAQGAKADSALQSIAKGTDGNYITTTIGAKADNSQTVSASLTIQAISTAGASAKGLAEASDVKDYIGSNTATTAQGSKADSALQQVVHGTDGLYVTTTVTQKVSNEQTIYTALTIQDIATADAQHQGVAESSDVKFYLDIMNATSEAYGVMWDTANPSPTLTRIGNMTNHALLPVQSQMIGGVMADDGTFTPFDNQADWTQATQARDGSDGQVMVRLPKHYRRCSTFGTYNIVMLSPVEIPGYVEVREQYVSAYEASLQRSTLKLSSVNNATADYRGGQNEASWDGTPMTLLNRPVSNIDLTEFRTYARNRAAGTSWNCLTYEAVRTIFWLFAVEYATLNSQSNYTSALDANGYHQGGLGIGVTDWNGNDWNTFNGYAPFIPCGVLDEYGSGTAVKNFSIYNDDTTLVHTFQCNKYRGIEMPFGHIWKYVDGVLINVESGDGVSIAYTTTDPANFSSTNVANYNAICKTYRVDSYIKSIVFNSNGDIFATVNGGNSTSYYCDQYWGSSLLTTTELRAWRFGGPAHHGAACGLACAVSYYVPGYHDRLIGSRLCFVP